MEISPLRIACGSLPIDSTTPLSTFLNGRVTAGGTPTNSRNSTLQDQTWSSIGLWRGKEPPALWPFLFGPPHSLHRPRATHELTQSTGTSKNARPAKNIVKAQPGHAGRQKDIVCTTSCTYGRCNWRQCNTPKVPRSLRQE